MTDPADLRVVDPGAGGEPAAAPDRESWIEAGRALSRTRSEASWEFADWLAAGHEAWGKDATKLAAEMAGTPRGKIINYLRAATTYPPTRRRVALTFSHHLETAFLPEADGDRILDAAEAGGWSRGETRSAAREASLEGKLARQARKIRELDRALKAARADAADASKQACSRLDAEHAIIRDAVRRAAAVPDGLVADGALDGLHGNARRGLARSIRRWANKIVVEVNGAIDRVEAAAAQIEGDS